MYRLGLMGGLLIVALLTGCRLATASIVTGSGNVVTREEPITGFDRVDVSGTFEVDIRQGEAHRVVVHVDDNLVQYLQVVKRGSTLEIGLRPGLRLDIRRGTRRAEVTLPVLAGLKLSGASQGTLGGLRSSSALDVDVSGASDLRGDIEAGDMTVDASGSSQVNLAGSGRALAVSASGASTVDLTALQVADAKVDASGASRVTVNVSDRLDADASGASRILYLGEPSLNVSTSGSSTVNSAD